MENVLTAVAPIVAVGALYVVMPVVTDAYRRFRGTRTVTCPDTQAPAEIVLDAMHAAIGAAFGTPDLQVKRCARWPEHQQCGQGCVAEVE